MTTASATQGQAFQGQTGKGGVQRAARLPLTLTSYQQVTRLCDLSVEGDSVTSVGWSERVSAEGSALGPAVSPQEEGRAPIGD